jgi:hypothetical protein
MEGGDGSPRGVAGSLPDGSRKRIARKEGRSAPGACVGGYAGLSVAVQRHGVAAWPWPNTFSRRRR